MESVITDTLIMLDSLFIVRAGKVGTLAVYHSTGEADPQSRI